MLFRTALAVFGVIHAALTSVNGLGTSCSRALGAGLAASTDPYWMENITHQGIAAYNSDPSTYQVFRNVKDFGAVGDGVTDDTAAINVSPAVVFFPTGTYLVSSPIIAYYYTQLIGDAQNPPTLLASSSFSGMAVIVPSGTSINENIADADPYIAGGGGAQYYTNQNNFFRSVRNFVIDVTNVPATDSQGTGIHWQVAQGTSLMNIVFEMSTASDTAHQGIWMENGSGGFMGDLVFNGGWTFQRININDCQIGFDINSGGTTEADQTTGAVAIIDATVTNTPIFVQTTEASSGTLAGSIVINNANLNNVPTAVSVASGTVVLSGGTTTISSWGQGNVYTGTSSASTFTQGSISAFTKPSVLLDGSGYIFGKTHPQYADYALSQIVSVRDNGATGDGTTDDTAALQAVLDEYSGCKIIFFDAGTYIVTSTLTIPAGTQMVGEAWSVIAGSGSAFQDQSNPQVVVRAGEAGSQGVLEISDIIFTTVGPAPGAIVLEWNVQQPSGQNGGAGMWDSHIRLGGAAGTNLEESQCPSSGAGGTTDCYAAFLALHLTSGSSAYLEGTWVWLADHDLDGDGTSQLTLYSGRGILSESAGPVWMIGTGTFISHRSVAWTEIFLSLIPAEHHIMYQYNLVNAQNHYMGMIQTETPYFQPSPAPPSPFSTDSSYNDPTFTSSLTNAWGLTVTTSTDIIVFGAGLYSFYSDYDQACLDSADCQIQILNVDSSSTISIYSLSTVATTYQISVNEVGIVNQSGNVNGFASTVTVWTP
ncbi:hypothetical protein H0H92_013404 [Tricholoma furcatifolium]|nr:hypothetical protein H0H92_013404 [Tricholoma furcatifolium]